MKKLKRKNRRLFFFFLVLIILAAGVYGAKKLGFFHPADLQNYSLSYEGKNRSYLVHVPADYSDQKSWPLVIALHDDGEKAADLAGVTNLNKSADQEGFIIVYPQAAGSTIYGRAYGLWNTSPVTSTSSANTDDVGFIGQMITALQKKYSISSHKIYVLGFGSGAQMSYTLACSPLSRKIAAIAPVAGVTTLKDLKSCRPARHVPIIHIHGLADPCALYSGGTCGNCASNIGSEVAALKLPPYTALCPSVPEYFSEWLALNKLPTKPLKVINQGELTCQYYGWNKSSLPMELCTIEDGGHTWPGGSYGEVCRPSWSAACLSVQKTYGNLNSQISANNLIWTFFKAHPLP